MALFNRLFTFFFFKWSQRQASLTIRTRPCKNHSLFSLLQAWVILHAEAKVINLCALRLTSAPLREAWSRLCLLGLHSAERSPVWFGSVQFRSGWYLCARKSPYVLHPVSQKFPQHCRWNGSNVLSHWRWPSLVLLRKIIQRFLFPRLSPPGVMSLALCLQVVSQASQHFPIWNKHNWHLCTLHNTLRWVLSQLILLWELAPLCCSPHNRSFTLAEFSVLWHSNKFLSHFYYFYFLVLLTPLPNYFLFCSNYSSLNYLSPNLKYFLFFFFFLASHKVLFH